MSQQIDLLSLSAKLDLQTAAFEKGVAQANRSMDKIDAKFKSSTKSVSATEVAMKSMARAAIAAFSVTAITSFVTATINAGDRLDKLSQVAGLSVEAFQKFEHVAKLGGVTTNEFASATATLSKRIGNARSGFGALAEGLKRLNPELLAALKNSTGAEDALLIMADAMKNAGTQAERNALSMAAFGDSANKMTIAFKGGADNVREIGEEIALLSTENAKAAAKMADEWETFSTNVSKTIQGKLLNDFGAAMKLAEGLGLMLEKVGFGASDAEQKLSPLGEVIDSLFGGLPSLYGSLGDAVVDVLRSFGNESVLLADDLLTLNRVMPALSKTLAQLEAATDRTTKAYDRQVKAARAMADELKGVSQEANDIWVQTADGIAYYAAKEEAAAAASRQHAADIETLNTFLGKQSEELEKIMAHLDPTIAIWNQYEVMIDAVTTAITNFVIEFEKGIELIERLESKRDKAITAVSAPKASIPRRGGGSGIDTAARDAEKIERENQRIAESFTRVYESLNDVIAAENDYSRAWQTIHADIDRMGVTTAAHAEALDLLKTKFEETMEEIKKSEMQELFETWGDSMRHDFIDVLLDGLGEAEFAFDDFVASALESLARLLLDKQLQGVFSLMPSLFGEGAVFTKGHVTPFADGGVVSGPTAFPMSGGIGIMGEAGPEAVAPLKRGPDGKLGVGSSPTNIQIINNTPAKVSTQESVSPNGTKSIRFLIEESVKGMFNDGTMDGTVSHAYGLTRRGY